MNKIIEKFLKSQKGYFLKIEYDNDNKEIIFSVIYNDHVLFSNNNLDELANDLEFAFGI